MLKAHLFVVHVAIWALVIAAGCGDDSASGTSDADSDVDSDTDSDADSDADGDADTDGDSDSDADSDADTSTWPEGCDGACEGIGQEYNECTCDPSDPCGWAGDGLCNLLCINGGYVEEMFDDSEDCEAAECSPLPWDEIWTYGLEYASGPYGFKGSMCYPAGAGPCYDVAPGVWTEGADHVPDICLQNASGVEVCLADHHLSSTYDLILVNYTTMWCSACNLEADSQDEFTAALEGEAWSVLFLEILAEDYAMNPPDLADAQQWVADHDLDPAHVMFDADQVWMAAVLEDAWPAEIRGWPMNFFVHPSNMLIWDSFPGWPDIDETESWNEWIDCLAGDGLLEELAAYPGAID